MSHDIVPDKLFPLSTTMRSLVGLRIFFFLIGGIHFERLEDKIDMQGRAEMLNPRDQDGF